MLLIGNVFTAFDATASSKTQVIVMRLTLPMIALLVGCVMSAQCLAANPKVVVSPEVAHDTSPSLSDMIRATGALTAPLSLVATPEPKSITRAKPPRQAQDPLLGLAVSARAGVKAPATVTITQTTFSPNGVSNGYTGFAGLGAGQYNFSMSGTPPDTNMAVGSKQVVQWVNSQYAVFDKATGALVSGPFNGNVLWSGFGGGCETNNNGDPIVKWDNWAQRWVMMQFSLSGGYLECVAVSTTDDATGTWNRYAFSYTVFPDYPKAGVWPDGYYVTFNTFGSSGNSYTGAKTCVYDRVSMLAGTTATQQCADLTTSYFSVLPADVDGQSTPPVGAPNYQLAFDNAYNALDFWSFHVDWVTPANSKVTHKSAISVAAFTPVGSVPQNSTTLKLDALSDRLMYRLAYRNLNGTESLLVTHAVRADATTGQGAIRWYQIQNPNDSTLGPVVAQQGTYQPDTALWRWMSTGAMDGAGNIAIGYSTSSATAYPALAIAARNAGDTAGTLGPETLVKQGTGSETKGSTSYTRWGDYAAMVVDPVDDSTMWFTSLYQINSGQFAWNTWISAFKISAPVPTPGISLSPASLSFGAQTATQNVTIASTGTADLIVSSIATTGVSATTGFSVASNTCPSAFPFTLNVGTNCTVTVSFAYSSGVTSDALAVTSNAPSATTSVALTGGITPVAAVSPATLTFSTTQAVGTSSSAKSLTVTNTGTGTLSGISSTITPGSGTALTDFSQTNGCTSILSPNATCQISVKFTPTSAGAKIAALTVQSNSTSPAPTVSLTGTAVTPVPVIALSKTSYDFGRVTTNSSSTKAVTVLSNTGTKTLTISGKVISGTGANYFTVSTGSGSCGSSLSAGASCSIYVKFAPKSSAVQTATLTINSNASNLSAATVSLSGS